MPKKRSKKGRKRAAKAYRNAVAEMRAGVERTDADEGSSARPSAAGEARTDAPTAAAEASAESEASRASDATELARSAAAATEDELELFSEPPQAGEDEEAPDGGADPVPSSVAAGQADQGAGFEGVDLDVEVEEPAPRPGSPTASRDAAKAAMQALASPASAPPGHREADTDGPADPASAAMVKEARDGEPRKARASVLSARPEAEDDALEASNGHGERKVRKRPLRVIAIGGARGGVGKTMLAVNLGLYLATIGRKVVLVDADAGGASIHTGLGTRIPRAAGRVPSSADDADRIPAEALASTNFQGLRLLYAGVDEPAASAFAPESRGDRLGDLMARLRRVDAEYVVVDLGVGLSRELLDAFLSADIGLFVTVPEPTAIENTYRFLRGAFVRFLLNRPLADQDRSDLEARLGALGGAPPPLDLLDELEREHHRLADTVRAAMQAFTPRVAINQTRLRADLELGFAMQSAARRRLGVRLDYLGHVDHDDTVWTCVRNRRPVLLDVPGAKSSKKIEKLARRLLLIEAGKDERVKLPSVPQHSHHDMLELDRGATDEEVRRAYKRSREVYAHDAMCCYGLLEPHEIEKLRARIDEAFDVLLDPARRRPYELSVFPDEPDPAPSAMSDEEQLEPGRSMPALDPDTQFTGALLRDVREARRVTLREISQRTKVGISYLRAIESEDFGKLPAVVYTTGFVTELARFLKLDARQVSRTYIQRYKSYLDGKQRGLLRRP